MTDRSRSGARCRTLHYLNTVEGVLPRDTYGTLRYEVDNSLTGKPLV